jgi:hypothetical protein
VTRSKAASSSGVRISDNESGAGAVIGVNRLQSY